MLLSDEAILIVPAPIRDAFVKDNDGTIEPDTHWDIDRKQLREVAQLGVATQFGEHVPALPDDVIALNDHADNRMTRTIHHLIESEHARIIHLRMRPYDITEGDALRKKRNVLDPIAITLHPANPQRFYAERWPIATNIKIELKPEVVRMSNDVYGHGKLFLFDPLHVRHEF